LDKLDANNSELARDHAQLQQQLHDATASLQLCDNKL